MEWRQDDLRYWLVVYDLRGDEDVSLRLLDKVRVGNVSWNGHPRVDSSHRVYVPCRWFGVGIFHYQDGRLLPAKDPLRCVGSARSVCVNKADTVFVGASNTSSVYLVSVSTDTVSRRLEKPAQVRGDLRHVSVLGQTVLVCYGYRNLVAYHSDSPTPGQVLQTPEGLAKVSSITSDSHSSSFLVTDRDSVFVLDNKFIWHRIYRGGMLLYDCALVKSQLWLGYRGRDIVVLTSSMA